MISKCMENLFYSPYFSFYTIFSDTATLEKSLRTTSYEKFGWIFLPLLAICLHAKNQCDPVIPSEIYVEGLPAITQERQFPQIWDLYSKMDNINFYLSTSPVRINDKIFQDKGKTLFWSQQLSTTAVVPQHLNVKDIE